MCPESKIGLAVKVTSNAKVRHPCDALLKISDISARRHKVWSKRFWFSGCKSPRFLVSRRCWNQIVWKRRRVDKKGEGKVICTSYITNLSLYLRREASEIVQTTLHAMINNIPRQKCRSYSACWKIPSCMPLFIFWVHYALPPRTRSSCSLSVVKWHYNLGSLAVVFLSLTHSPRRTCVWMQVVLDLVTIFKVKLRARRRSVREEEAERWRPWRPCTQPPLPNSRTPGKTESKQMW